MPVWGADVAELRSLGKKLDAGAQAVTDQRTKLGAALNATTWLGPDAEKFKNEWSSHHVPALNKVAEALRQAGQSAKKNANEQEHASRS